MGSDRASELNDRLQQAIALIQAGRPDEARRLLEAIVAADPAQELAWLWLASVSTDRAERIAFLERALALNPANETARAAYTRLTGETPPEAALGTPAPTPARAAITPGTLLIVMAVVAVAVAAVLVALYLRDSDAEPREGSPAATLAPLISPTPSAVFSLTPSDTPWPTGTPGPSPTLVWDSALPTWTAAPTSTPAPTRRVATWTPRPPSATPAMPPPPPPQTSPNAPQETPAPVESTPTEGSAAVPGGRVTAITRRNWSL
ncbi:MAG TPA: tetratricopeptide repeat protein [Aggregatilineaceae bacterium]|nr:tetratricopeptide repeat protein [Aggregatilineaceae bacterium]